MILNWSLVTPFGTTAATSNSSELSQDGAIIYLTYRRFGLILGSWKRQTLSTKRLSGSLTSSIAASS